MSDTVIGIPINSLAFCVTSTQSKCFFFLLLTVSEPCHWIVWRIYKPTTGLHTYIHMRSLLCVRSNYGIFPDTICGALFRFL